MHAWHREAHRLDSAGWLRASVLGANDGIVSTASLILGVAASRASHDSILIAGIAGLVAGAMSMATGEYVSVQSQADTEAAALGKQRAELSANVEGELHELAQIYVARGLAPDLANQVAASLMAHDALAAHSQDELGITSATSAKPLQAAGASALSFAVGALLPLLVVMLAPPARVIAWTVAATLVALAFWAAWLSGAAAVGIGMLVGTAVWSRWSALSRLPLIPNISNSHNFIFSCCRIIFCSNFGNSHVMFCAVCSMVFKTPMSSQWENHLAPLAYDGAVYTNAGMYAFKSTGELMFTALRRRLVAVNVK